MRYGAGVVAAKFLAAILALTFPALTFLAYVPAALAGGIIDEADIGLSAHDIPFGVDHKEGGVDANGEILFASPDILQAIFAPRPDVGVMINSDDKNSFAYFGLTWTVTMLRDVVATNDGIYGGLGLGGAVHDGPDVSTDPDHKGLGSRALFHESLELGYRAAQRWSLSVFLDHVSNADLAPHNPGLTDVGLRTGYKF